MKRVKKSREEPAALSEYRLRFARQASPPSWKSFAKNRKRRDAVANQMLKDQKGLCAYCEINLSSRDNTVEHFVPRTQSTRTNNWDLKWDNLLLCCSGGNDKRLFEDPERFTQPADDLRSCGSAKYDFSEVSEILNPLSVPAFPCLFRFRSEDGSIVPDAKNCDEAGFPVERVKKIIDLLGLRAPRLCRNRLKRIQQLTRDCDTSPEAEVARDYFSPTQDWPAYFTTYRWFLGAAAESQLRNIAYDG